jgi:predicted NUDIX family phosphoesterase
MMRAGGLLLIGRDDRIRKMPGDLEAEVAALEAQAEKLRSLLVYAPRPLVIEFAGTPKSGKSTSVEAVRHFLSRHGFRVHVLAERAAVCPIPMKGHLFFNTWCATSMLAELLANIETDTDVILVDRGIFDALVWLTLQQKRGELNASEVTAIEGFLLLERWRSLVDLAVVMSVPADQALARENAQRITAKGGSIMNPDVLTAITAAVSDSIDRYGSYFRGVLPHSTGAAGVRQSTVALAGELLSCLEAFLNPEILVVPRTQIEQLSLANGGAFDEVSLRGALKCVTESGFFIHRAEAESDSRADLVQIVSCATLWCDKRVFLFQRKENDPKYRLYGKTTIWQGCHVGKREGVSIRDLLLEELRDRIARSLFLSRVFPTELLGYCWDATDPHSSRHFGFVFRMEIDNPHTAADLRKKEFRKKRGHGWVGQFDAVSDLRSNQDPLNLETWSRAILRHVGGP